MATRLIKILCTTKRPSMCKATVMQRVIVVVISSTLV